MDREVIARCCRNAGLREERRQKVLGYDCFIADGYCGNPEPIFWRFGIKKEDFPLGCYATFWWIARGEDHIELGCPMFFEAFHDRQLQDDATRKKARINKALQEAELFIVKRKKVRANGH